MTSVPALHAYRAQEVMTDSPGQCVVKLYKHLAVMLRRARTDLSSSSFESAMANLDKARATIEELLCSLDFEQGGEIAVNLARIYGYMLRELLAAGIRRDPDTVSRIVMMTEDLLGAWIVAAEQEEMAPHGP